MIKERRKDQKTASRKAPKKASNADRSIATGRAKREAAMKAKRGLAQSKKPNAMDVEREVYRQSRQTAKARKANEKKQTHGRVAPNSSLRDKKAKGKKKNDPPAAVFGGRTPSKKAVEAAIKGMEAAGFQVPKGHQVMMTFIPTPTAPQTTGGNKGKKGGAPGKGGNKGKGK